MKDNRDKLKEFFVSIILLVLIFLRIVINSENNIFISSIGYIGVLIALLDLYIDANRTYGKYDQFNVIRGVCYVLMVPLAVLLVLFLTGIITINSTWNDVFTLSALLISLPEDLYLILIEKYIKKGYN